jgi:hypothetical protein
VVRYQVLGMRPGPDAGTTVYSSSGSAAEVTVAPVPGAAPGSASGGTTGAGSHPTVAGGGAVAPTGSGQQSAHREIPSPLKGRSTTPTTADTGYQERLPFQAPTPVAAGDSAAVARVADDGEGTRRQTLLLVAGASTAFSWAMALRFLSRRALVGIS